MSALGTTKKNMFIGFLMVSGRVKANKFSGRVKANKFYFDLLNLWATFCGHHEMNIKRLEKWSHCPKASEIIEFFTLWNRKF